MRFVCIDTVGVDYMAVNNFRIRWQPDQVDPRYIPTPTGIDPAFEVIIIDDDIPEPREYFEIDLTRNPTGDNRNGFFFPRAVGRVTIIDDDSRKFPCNGHKCMQPRAIRFCTIIIIMVIL
jgi:hypothetical protein